MYIYGKILIIFLNIYQQLVEKEEMDSIKLGGTMEIMVKTVKKEQLEVEVAGHLYQWNHFIIQLVKRGSGTSYSGGTGSGGGSNHISNTGAGSDVGGAGGYGDRHQRSGTSGALAGGGAGNPTGNYRGDGYPYEIVYTSSIKNGTGGLLTIYSDKIINNGYIDSDGVGLGNLVIKTNDGNIFYGNHVAPGGSSGGGSINIFYKSSIKQGTITANGGNSSIGSVIGGAGGNGSISIGQLLNGTYTSTYTNY